MQETHLPPHDATPREKELWKKADRRRRQQSTPLVVEQLSVKRVVSGTGADGSPKTAQRVPVKTRTVFQPK
jgi:hypothetical protein